MRMNPNAIKTTYLLFILYERYDPSGAPNTYVILESRKKIPSKLCCIPYVLCKCKAKMQSTYKVKMTAKHADAKLTIV